MSELIALEKIAQREKLKALVLDRVSSPITKRVYNMALNEFMVWFRQAPRPGFHQGHRERMAGIAGRTPPRVALDHRPHARDPQETLLSAPGGTTAAGLRDRAIIVVLLGCGLRR